MYCPYKQKVKIQTLQDLVSEKTGIPNNEQYLIYGGKKLEEQKTLGDYPTLGHGATVFLVMRLPGGGGLFSSRRHSYTVEERCCTVEERWTRIAVDSPGVEKTDEPCMLSLVEGVAVKMPCGHPISPEWLMDYCWNEIKFKKYEIRCPLCATEWPIDVLRRCGGADENELHFLEEGLSKNYCESPDNEITTCPRCKSYCTRKNSEIYSMQCRICSRERNTYRFCFKCKREWSNGGDEYSCGNSQCTTNEKDRKEILKNCPEKEILQGVFCPDTRECPVCQTLIKHGGKCKKVSCRVCKTSFCFVCLRPKTSEGSWMCGGGYEPCAVAPRQM